MLEQSILLIQKLLLNIQTIWFIFIKTLKIIIQIKNEIYIYIYIDDMIADMLSNKKNLIQ